MSPLTLTAAPVETPAQNAPEPTPAEQAARYAAVLARLLRENPKLPLLIWSVYPSGLVGRAVGKSDWHVTTAVQAWARAFRVRAEVSSVPQIVARRRPAGGVQWVVEPGEITAFIPPFDGTIVGELVEVKPGDWR